MRAAKTDQTSPAAAPAASRAAARLRAVHPLLWAAYAALATGAVLCVTGWYGISGERFAERQLPYLASCTVPGAALIVAGAVLLAHGRGALAAARVEELYGLLVALDDQVPGAGPAEQAATPLATSDALLIVPGGGLLHRADCPLVSGKADAVPPAARDLRAGAAAPCPICAPPLRQGSTDPTGPED
ncbi:hypothetical protein [Streptomyces aureocirculatus]|uniref:hypothetical protein n=1 Tax=Streptomyces aureocirculatus TaxID=67275 RepID=UPI000AA766E6|nr:hypothetical protein [Streptomyces aureocirculatus]